MKTFACILVGIAILVSPVVSSLFTRARAAESVILANAKSSTVALQELSALRERMESLEKELKENNKKIDSLKSRQYNFNGLEFLGPSEEKLAEEDYLWSAGQLIEETLEWTAAPELKSELEFDIHIPKEMVLTRDKDGNYILTRPKKAEPNPKEDPTADEVYILPDPNKSIDIK